MASGVTTIRWGILATGMIAGDFAKDLLTNPACRDVHDVKHEVFAAASSSSVSRAQSFLEDIEAPSSAKAYGSYAELVQDPDVDVVYVATPHSHHFQNAMLCLQAGKNVLCEKALTVNAAQARKLIETAKAKNLFFMEAVWTRYFPLSIKIREMVMGGVIGRVHRVIADLSIAFVKEDGSHALGDSHRMVNPDLAGGSLLDLGIYALTWNFQILYHCQPKPREAPSVIAAIDKYSRTGADDTTSMILHFPKQNSMGIALTSQRLDTDTDGKNSAGAAIRIQGTKGEIQVMGPAYRPTRYRVIMKDGDGKVEEVECPIPTDKDRGNRGHGMFWEADEVARCLRDGKKESETLSWEESLVIMETMDSVRKQGGLVYPELIETDVYDENGLLNRGRA
ncbi:MAG: D-xylose 1-dehydrogenase (NADP(+)) [Claussenomyces sp. TS43310]|nr:MAG: D-xylose 1-dehydrogenase (NADP(+)) [Claussenomyces sp. TS43310]